VSRIETGQVSATPRDVRDMLELYRVSDAQREAMVQIAREARQRGWWQKFVDVPDGVPAYFGLEVAATSIDVYMSLIVPALLQTADYARAVIGAVRPDLPGGEIDRRVELRMRRQALLDQEQPASAAGPAGRHRAAAAGGRAGGHGRPAAAAAGGRGPAGRHHPVLEARPARMPGWTGRSRSSASRPPAERDVVALDSAADALYLESPRTWPATGGCSSCCCRRPSRPRRRPSSSPSLRSNSPPRTPPRKAAHSWR
jgi:hypothetical protein